MSESSARCAGQRMVVFNAVEERDLRSRNKDACRLRLGRWKTAVMCMWRGKPGSQSTVSGGAFVQARKQCGNSRWVGGGGSRAEGWCGCMRAVSSEGSRWFGLVSAAWNSETGVREM